MSDKLRNKFWREENVQKTKFQAAEMILDLWNQQAGTQIITYKGSGRLD